MKVSDIIQIKGSVVKTVRPETSARELSVRLHADQIGAMVVSSDGRSIDGIVTERDLAYGLAAHGSNLPTIAVSRLMTNVVVVCSPDDSIAHVMKLMTPGSATYPSMKAISLWESLASATFSNTDSMSSNWKPT